MWNRRVQGRDFWQTFIEGAGDGVCFRLAFKWLACQFRNPGGFAFGWWNSTLDEDALKQELQFLFEGSHADTKEARPMPKAASIAGKQTDYLRRVAPYECAGKPYATFKKRVSEISLDTLRSWQHGTQAKHTSAKYDLAFSCVDAGSTLQADHFRQSMILGIFGDGPEPWAHATAFFRSPKRVAFFDANGGEFRFDTTEANGVIATEVEPFLRGKYEDASYSIDDFVLFPAAAR